MRAGEDASKDASEDEQGRGVGVGECVDVGVSAGAGIRGARGGAGDNICLYIALEMRNLFILTSLISNLFLKLFY
jgi:hypothetical protein